MIEQEMLEAGHTRNEIRQILEGIHIQRGPDRPGEVEVDDESSSSRSVIS